LALLLNENEPLFLAPNGNLYIPTNSGGAHSTGTAYRLTPPARAGGTWQGKVLMSFQPNGSGGGPHAYLSWRSGLLVGTTHSAENNGSVGTVFQLNP